MIEMLVLGVEAAAEVSAFAEFSAKEAEIFGDILILRTDCVEGGRSGRNQRNSLNQKERFARDRLVQSAHNHGSVSLSCVVGLSSLKPMLVNSQGRDFRLKRLSLESKLGGGSSRARDLAPAISQRRFNDVLFMLGKCGA